MIAMAISDGDLGRAELRTIAALHRQLTGVSIRPARIQRLAERMRRDGHRVRDALAAVNGRLDDSLRSLIVKAAFLVLMADSAVDDRETALLDDIATGLALPPDQFEAMLAGLRKWAPQGTGLGMPAVTGGHA